MSNIFHKIEHGITHAAKEVGSAVEGIATQKVAETIVDSVVDVLESPATEEMIVDAVEVL